MIALATLLLLSFQLSAIRWGWPHPDRIPRLWHRLALRLLEVRVHIVGRPAQSRPLLIVSNHISWADICVLSAAAPVSFVAKADMAGWPVFGLLAKLQRAVFVERDKRRSSGVQASELGRRLAAGDAMVLFAEGTTSDGNGVLPFKTTLFAAAQSALASGGPDTPGDVTIQPVTIVYTRLHGMPMGRLHRPVAAWTGEEELIPHLGALLREGAIDAELHFAEPVRFSAGSNRKAVARQVEQIVRTTMAGILRAPQKP